MRLLIIGGTGLLSGAVVKEAQKKGIEVTIVNRGIKSKIMPQGVKVITADFRNEIMMSTALQDLHFDAAIDFICFNKEQMEYSVKLLSRHCDQYIFISSACVYNYALPGVKTEDSEKVFEKWSYSVNKWASECCLTELAKELKFNYTIIRPCITYDDSRIPYGMTPPYGYHWTIVGRILSGKPIIRWNGGTTKWNMMRVEDFVVGFVGIVGNEQAYNQVYNISGDNAYSWNDVISCVEKAVKKKAVIYDLDSDEYTHLSNDKEGRIYGRSSDLICSNQKIKDLVPEFKTTYDLQDGIMKTIEGYKSRDFERGIDYVFDANMDRTIIKSCKKHGIKPSDYKLSFVDYLDNATNKEKLKYYAIRNGVRIVNTKFGIPLIGFGTFPYKEVLTKCIPTAILGGVKLIDTSDNYENEDFVGKGLAKVYLDNVIVIGKFSQPLRTYELEKCFEESKQKLGKLNIYLLHWPYPYLWKKQWKRMEDLYLEGKCDAIGVCNFDLGYMKELLAICRVKPTINQFERHPLFQQQELVDFCIDNDIVVMAYSPVARMDKELHESHILKSIANKYGKTVIQVILRWDIDTNCVPIPASSSEEHIKENFDIFDFHLTNEEIAAINSLENGKRVRFNPRTRFSRSEIFRMLTYRFGLYGLLQMAKTNSLLIKQ